MALRPQNERILFGLKLRQLRAARGLSFQQLAALTGISVSYLNEIERGKKSPKPDKMADLARALEVESGTLSDRTLDAAMMPVAELLRSNFLNELPLDRFGIELAKIVEIIAGAPARVGAFISTLLELSRNYALRDESFYVGALRSWLEMHENFLLEPEQAAADLRLELGWSDAHVPGVEELAQLLRGRFDYHLDVGGLDAHPAFDGLERVLVPVSRTTLLKAGLSAAELRYHLAEELGYAILDPATRSLTAPSLRVRGFDEALAQANSSAFAGALLLPAEALDAGIESLISEQRPRPSQLVALCTEFAVTPLLLFDRLAGLLPARRGIRSLFLLELTEQSGGGIQVSRELHLGTRHRPHSTGLDEHYCRRWVASRLLADESEERGGERSRTRVGVQLERFEGTDEEYFVFALADREPSGRRRVVCIGLPHDAVLRRQVRFLSTARLPSRQVANTCERCALTDCEVRAAPPVAAEARARRREVRETIDALQRQARQAARRSRKRI